MMKRMKYWLPGVNGAIMCLMAAFLAPAALAQAPGAQTSGQQALVVLELFTSQGCSSCPPADALMKDWAKQPNVLPLSLHVDYWDYLGWRDTFGKKGHSIRQQDYARNMGARQIYTPQAVIDGEFEAIGSDRATVAAMLEKARQKQRLVLQAARDGNGRWQVSVPAMAGWKGDAKVLLCRYDRHDEVKVERGENHGRTLEYLNVARAWNTFGSWHGEAASYTVPDLGNIDWRQEGVVVMLQSLKGPILGAIDLQPAK